jgi:hypothetical protein
MFEPFSNLAVSISKGKNQTKMFEDRRPLQNMAVFRIRTGSGFNWVSGSGRIQVGHNRPPQKRKILERSFEGFKKTYLRIGGF